MSKSIHLCLCALCALPSGCGSSQRPSSFPTQEALLKILQTPVALKQLRPTGTVTSDWTLEGPLPDTIQVSPATALPTWGQPLVDAARRSGGRALVTEAMACVARELGQLWLRKHATPTPDLTEFIVSRCGSPCVSVQTIHQTADLPGSVSEATLPDAMRPALEKAAAQLVADDRSHVGAWFGREGSKVVWVGVRGIPRVEVKPVSIFPDERHTVTIEGRVLVDVQELRALVNTGSYGYSPCTLDPLELPSFRVRCPADPKDRQTWISIIAVPKGRLLGQTVLQMVTWPQRAAENRYQETAYFTDAGFQRAGLSSLEILAAAVNHVRSSAKLAPVSLAQEQSRTITGLCPHYFAAALGALPPTIADVIALGLLAGWSVPGLIEEGWFASAQRESSDPLPLVSSLLSRPAGRLALLNPAARQLAMGTVSEASIGLYGGIFVSYALAVPREPRENQDAFMKVLNERRRQNGKGPAALAPDLRDAALSIAGKIEQGRMSVEDAQDALLEAVQSGAPGRARGWRLEVHSLETMSIPRELLTSSQVQIAVVVAHHKPTGHPWAVFDVIIAVRRLLQEA